jgi:hypothetical protein
MKGKLAERKGRGQQGCPGDFMTRGPQERRGSSLPDGACGWIDRFSIFLRQEDELFYILK